jgi:hypothetical protein
MSRFVRIASAALVLIGVIAAASAQAAGNTKPYTANVRVANAADPNTFHLTLTNDPKASQSLGSANFTLPTNFTAPDGTGAISNAGAGFDVKVVSNVVQFRAKSSSTALGKSGTVSADVTVTVPAVGPSCPSATWSVAAKQSNDFSGTPGNEMTLGPSDLTPLGSFTIDHIGTVADALFPTVLTTASPDFTPFGFNTTALDTCGHVKTNYSGATLDYSFLTNATFFSVSANKNITKSTYGGTAWSGGVANVNVSPVLTETPNSLTVTDGTTAITKTSNVFDVVDLACTSQSAMCEWQNSSKKITATTAPPGQTGSSIGIGFNDTIAGTFSCGGRTTAIGGSIMNFSPHNLPTGQTTYTVTLTFTKQASGNGPASGFVVCLVDSMPTAAGDWNVSPTPDCPTVPPATADAPCVISKKRVSGGLLQIVLFLAEGDPWGGVG